MNNSEGPRRDPLDGAAQPQRPWLDRLPLSSLLLDGQGAVLDVNRLSLPGLGYRPEVGSAFEDVLDLDERPVFRALLALLSSSPGRTEVRQLRLAAGAGVCRLHLASAPGELPGTVSIVVQAEDVSDIVARTEDLDRRESRWSLALSAARTGIWEYDARLDRPFYSDTWKALRGLGPDDPVPMQLDEILAAIHPDDRERVTQVVLSQRLGDDSCNVYDYRLKRPDGSWIWIECRSSVTERDAGGVPLRIVGTDIEITDRKKAEETLARLSRRLRVALDASRIGVFEADFDTETVEWDAGMLQVYGLSAHQDVKIGGLWESMLHPEDRERVFGKVDHHVAHLLPFSDEYRIVLGDGSVRYIRSHTMPFIDADGHRRMIGANWDVTEDRTLRRDLETANRLAEARNRELEVAKAEIERIAFLDPLTNLPNRRLLEQKIGEMIARPDECPRGMAVLQIDLDRFKQINDTFGHDAGDTVLTEAADILRRTMGPRDFVARTGGDEFVVFAMGVTDPEKLTALASCIVDQMRKPILVGNGECRLGASIGIAVGCCGADSDPHQLLLNADIALYTAKNKGRNRFEFFRRESRSRMLSDRQKSDELLIGIERGEFIPYYQPQFRTATLDIAGVETLARWRHPVRGILTPDAFLAVAEDLDVMAQIDRCILEQALVDLAVWESEGLIMPKCSVNVSARRLGDPELVKSLTTLPLRHGNIAFELLESVFLDDIDEQVADNLAQIKHLGIDIEIDDFGTGHASIVSLLRLRPSLLKIDRQLVQSITGSTEQRGLVRAIIRMGHSLGIEVLAEGVETDAHVHALRALKCDYLQGFGLARPMPASELAGFARAAPWRRKA